MKHYKPPIIAESVIHETVIEHLRTYSKPGVIFWHSPNGGKRSAQWAAKLKRMGVLPGVSDIVLFYGGQLFALELKSRAGRATEAQLDFIAGIEKQGGYGCTCNSIDAAVRVLKSWSLLL